MRPSASIVILGSFLLSACGGGGGGAVSVLPPTTVLAAAPVALPTTAAGDAAANHARMAALNSVTSALAQQQRADGAIIYSSTMIMPYYANEAATGAAQNQANAPMVQRWMQWYIAHTADANRYNIPGALTDYTIEADGSLKSTGSADSVDAYAATFLTVAATLWTNGGSSARAYVQSVRPQIELIASAIDAVTDRDGLTWAAPDQHQKYIMDNSEVYHGLTDLALLRSQAFNDPAGAAAATQHAARIGSAIETHLWNASRSQYAVELDEGGGLGYPRAKNYLENAAQLWPILHGVIPPTSSRARTLYAAFNTAFPKWPQLKIPDQYPWASVAFVALLMNDATRAATYANSITQTYGTAFAWPWYCAESGWFIRVLGGLAPPYVISLD